MKTVSFLRLFFPSLMALGLAESFVKIPFKKTSFNPKSIPEMEIFTSFTIKKLKGMSQNVDHIIRAQRAVICCNDSQTQDDVSLAMRSALFTSILALNRLQETTRDFQANLELNIQECPNCEANFITDPTCSLTDWQCPDGKCVSKEHQCDGVDDCEDSSDENVENCGKNPCGKNYLCVADQVCIPQSYACDSQPDCSDGTDEADCVSTPTTTKLPSTCAENDFKCESDGVCVPASFQCDGVDDCEDGSDESSCHSKRTVTCAENDFKCESDGVCVPASYQCDGDDDCEDGSDESSCHPKTTVTCGTDDFKCESGNRCVPNDWRCDGEPDCTDGSDEDYCHFKTPSPPPTTTTTTTTTCAENDFKCESDGVCVLASYQCDGHDDCEDGSDESSCHSKTTVTCGKDDFKCESGNRCVPNDWRCDGEPDCTDGSDEEYCHFKTPSPPPTTTTTTTTTCAENDFKCESDGVCVLASYQCDGHDDCEDGSDESSCHSKTTVTCGTDDFKCESGNRCVPNDWRCDGEPDCTDGSDEEYCHFKTPSPPPTTTTTTTTTCAENDFKCESDGVCVPASYQCDGVDDCEDGSDESSCHPKTTVTCGTDDFKCDSGNKCVPNDWRCDGDQDCTDGSDEDYCHFKTPSPPPTTATTTGCEEDKVQCESSKDCIPSLWRCDGYRDCPDGSDEKNCRKVVKNKCQANPCSHGCVETPWHIQGFLCTCPDGMTLLTHDRHTCVQIRTQHIKD